MANQLFSIPGSDRGWPAHWSYDGVWAVNGSARLPYSERGRRAAWALSLDPLETAPTLDAILSTANSKRIQGGMSWRQVAIVVDCAASTLSRWSNGRSPSVQVALRVWQWATE